MPSPLDSEPGRRLLIAAGTAHFAKISDHDLPLVPDELKRIAKSFSALGYKRQRAEQSLDPGSKQDLEDFFADVTKESRGEDLIVVYYTSHGAEDENEKRFYLLTRDSDLSDLHRTALAAEDLARALILNSKASQILVILDVCYAGAGAAAVAQLANRVATIRGSGPAIFVISAARPKEEAEQGILSSALAAALGDERLGGRVQVFLTIDDMMASVKGYLRDKQAKQVVTLSVGNMEGPCRLFPNPRYRPEVRPGLDLETYRAFAEHWELKARGAELGAGGWYFTGREQALKELALWLSTERSDGRARVVTGGPGCGKSAVLARVVTLADNKYRKEILFATRPGTFEPATLPPEGVVNVAVHARHKLLAHATAEIAAGLGVAARDEKELLAALARRSEKVVIVVDAVDEADDKEKIASLLLEPLAKLPQIFLLVGTRPNSPEHGRRYRVLGEATVEIDLDDSRYIGADDVARYVERRLLAVEEPGRRTPYRDLPIVAHTIAGAVAERAHNVFLVAHTVVQALLTAQTIVDVNQPGWVERLPTGLDDAFTQFLAEFDRRQPGGLSRAVLLPLAFAEGEGLPWVDLWAAIASALSGSSVSDEDVAHVRDHAAAFVVESLEQDRSVYRLYHERFAEHLRGSVADATEVQQRIVGALCSRVPTSPSATRPDWPRAHPYVLTHLAAHALKAGMLAEFVADGMFLALADPLRTLQALSMSADLQTRRAYACYLIAFDRLRDESADARLSYLQMTARQQGDDSLAEAWGRDGLPRRWTVPWARWLPVTPHRRTSAETRSLALGTLDGRPVIVSGGWDGTVRVWDLASGAQRGEPLRGHEGAVASVALGTLEGRPVIVSGGWDRTMRVWDLASWSQRGEPLRGHDGGVNSVALGTLEGRPVIVSGGQDATVRVWDLATGAPRGEPLRGHDYGVSSVALGSGVNSVALGTLDGGPVIVSGGQDATVRVWDLASGAPRGEPLRGHDGGVNSVALGTLEGRPVIVSGGKDATGWDLSVPGQWDGTVRVWDLASGAPRGEPLRGHDGWVSSVALGTLEGRPVIVSGGGLDATVRVWDLASGAPCGEPLQGHELWVHSVALGTLEGRPVIVSGGEDATVRVWDLASGAPRGEPLRGHTGGVTAVAVGTLDGRPVIVSGGSWDVRVWDLASGAPRGEPLGPAVRVNSIALGTLEGRLVIVSGEWGTVRVWDLASGAPRGEPLRGHDDGVNSVALGTLEGWPVIVSGGMDATVRVWDLATGAPRGEPLRGHEGEVSSVALGTLEGWPVIVSGGGRDSTVRVWDLASGAPRGDPLRGHDGGVTSVALGTLEGRPVIVSGGGPTVRVWDLASGAPRGEPLRGHRGEVTSVALGTLDGRPVIVSGGRDAVVRLWDAQGVALSEVGIGSSVRGLAFAGPGTVVVAANQGLLVLQFASGAIARAPDQAANSRRQRRPGRRRNRPNPAVRVD